MADRTLNEISSATDFANAYTEDASGNQVKISKADMASVLAAKVESEAHKVLSFTLQPGEEVDTGFTNYGLYIAISISTGGIGLIIIGAGTSTQYAISNDNKYTADVNDTSNNIVFIGRKAANGHIFIHNKSNSERSVRIKQIKA